MPILRNSMKMPVRAVFIAAAMTIPTLFGLALPGSAHADLSVCNNTSETVRVAAGYSAVEGLVSGGWWIINPNGCARVVGDDEVADRTRYWVYAEEVGGGDVWEGGTENGDMEMCTAASPFTIHVDGCADRGFVVHNFSALVAPSGSMRTHIRHSGGGGNIDDNQ